MIAIIDYEAGNIRSVQKAVIHCGQEAVVTSNTEMILAADKVILPGVGAFGSAMMQLTKGGLNETIKTVIANGTPFLGICLGLQLLFEASEESPDVKGLGIFKGKIVKIPQKDGIKIPHIGWNSIEIQKNEGLFKNISQSEYFYFVHSYFLKSSQEDIVAAKTHYSADLDIAVEHNNIHAVQFHPEKSGTVGLRVLENFLNM